MDIKLEKMYGLFINGEFVPAQSGRTFKTCNPATGEVLAQIAMASADDVDCAVKAAWAAFSSWKKTTARERSEIMWKIADIVEENLEYFSTIETLDNGKTLEEARADITDVVDQFRYFAGCIRTDEGSYVEQDNHGFNIIRKEPLGVVAQIVPWNYPLSMAGWKMAPALAAGNCIVIKPASNTPLSLLEFARLAGKELPNGVLNVVTGSGHDCGEALTAHPGIRKVAFTGSTDVGTGVGETAGKNMIPFTLELGGKSAHIIFPDCQWDRALNAVKGGILGCAGQICSAGSRLFVHKDIYDKFVEELADCFAKVRVGNGLESGIEMGPLVDERQMETVLKYIDIGIKEGARLVTGGRRITEKFYNEGFFIEPTLFADVTNHMRIAQEEIFGPVLSAIPFTSEKEVIEMANDSPYGLAGGVWTQDINRGIRVVSQIDAGLMWLNTFDMYPAGTPFGGYKKSGFGREAHKMTMEEYFQVKTIYVSIEE